MSQPDPLILLGKITSHVQGNQPIRFTSDDARIAPFLASPWLTAFACERLELRQNRTNSGVSPSRESYVALSTLKRHGVLFGASGSGKTRLALHLLSEQLRCGYSAVAIDPKPDTIDHLLACAQAAGLTPRQVTLLSPVESERGVPGWNPLDYVEAKLPIAQIVGGFVSIIERSATSWGPRLREVLVNALTLISSQRLTLYELVRFLQREDYREGLLRRIAARGYKGYSSFDAITVREAVEYFTREIAGWSKSEKSSAIAPVLNKVRELLRVPFLRSMLCARKNQLDLSRLWERQELVLVHLDRTALGDEGVKLLGGLLVWQLYQTAMRVEGPTPVILSLDELGVGEQFIGKAVTEILAIARSRNLRVLAACQHLDQLSDDLRAALLTSTGFRAFFRLGVSDARLVAASLAAGTGESVTRVSVEPARADGVMEIVSPLVDEYGIALRLSSAAWRTFREESMHKPHEALSSMRRLGLVSRVRRMYVQPPGEAAPVEIDKYLRGLRSNSMLDIADDSQEAIGFVFRGPAPLCVGIQVPRLKVSVTSRQTESERQQRWTRLLMDLPVQHAIAWSGEASPPIVRVLPVPDADENPAELALFTEQILSRFNAQEALDDVERYRREQVEQVATGLSDEPSEPAYFDEECIPAEVVPVSAFQVADDGSIV